MRRGLLIWSVATAVACLLSVFVLTADWQAAIAGAVAGLSPWWWGLRGRRVWRAVRGVYGHGAVQVVCRRPWSRSSRRDAQMAAAILNHQYEVISREMRRMALLLMYGDDVPERRTVGGYEHLWEGSE